MIELIESIGKIINISTDLMRCALFKCRFHHAVEFGQLQLQCFLTVASACSDPSFARLLAGLLIFSQDGFDSYNRIQDVRTSISF
ncbi:Uncharacterised protein [Dorea longicatena]|nr:Uncharacterised protein [Dorea longicatena]